MGDSLPTPQELEERGLDGIEQTRWYQYEQARALSRLVEVQRRAYDQLRQLDVD